MNETQTTLPFPEWRISRRWGALLAIVNTWAASLWSDPQARFAVYRLKDRILTRHGIPDGTDLQILTLHCRACNGRGHHGPEWRVDFCRKCLGSGIYAKDFIPLGRFQLGGRLFHIPNSLARYRVACEDLDRQPDPATFGHRGIILGTVQHGRVPRASARWGAFLILTLRFDRERGPEVVSLWWRDTVRSLRFWWSWGPGSRWRVRLERAREGLPVNWTGENEDPSVPF